MTATNMAERAATQPALARPSTSPRTAPGTRRNRVGPIGAQRATMTALWALVGIGACSGVFAVLTRPAIAQLVETRPPAEAEGVGVRFVASFLTARTRDELQQTVTAYMGASTQTPGRVIARPIDIVSAFPVGGRRLAERYWSVTVGVSSPNSAMSYWTTSVRRTLVGGWIVVSLPSRVVDPAPLGEGQVRQMVQASQLTNPDEPAVVTVQGWLDAFLTGTGAIERYALPGSRFRPIVPTPYTKVEITRIGMASAPKRRVVVVNVIASTPDGGRQPLQYALELYARGPRWEVARLYDAPPLAGMRIAAPPTYAATRSTP